MLAPMDRLRFVGKVVLSLLGVVWLVALLVGVDVPTWANAAFGVILLLTGGLMAKDAAEAKAKREAQAAVGDVDPVDVDPITGLPRPPSLG